MTPSTPEEFEELSQAARLLKLRDSDLVGRLRDLGERVFLDCSGSVFLANGCSKWMGEGIKGLGVGKSQNMPLRAPLSLLGMADLEERLKDLSRPVGVGLVDGLEVEYSLDLTATERVFEDENGELEYVSTQEPVQDLTTGEFTGEVREVRVLRTEEIPEDQRRLEELTNRVRLRSQISMADPKDPSPQLLVSLQGLTALSAHLEQIRNPRPPRRNTPHGQFAAHCVQNRIPCAQGWQELASLGAKSLGREPVYLQGYEGHLYISPPAEGGYPSEDSLLFSNSPIDLGSGLRKNPPKPVTKSAFRQAYDRARKQG
jgi:hypothetical protein